MNNLLPDFDMWRKKYSRATFIVYVVTIILEIVIFLFLKQNDMIVETIPKYLRRYFISPIAWNTIVCLLCLMIARYTTVDIIKNSMPEIALTCMFGGIAVIHNVFTITMFLFCIPIFMTIVFGSKKLLLIISIISTCFVGCVIAYVYTHNEYTRNYPYFLPSALIAIVGIWVCYSIAKTLIELLNEQNDKLINAVEAANNANESKSAFLSNMSHEIRTPMNAIVGITEIMLRTKRDVAEERYLLNIKSAGEALLAIINDILDFSKIESGKMELIEENYSIHEMLDELSLMFWNRIGDKNIELIYDIDESLPDKLIGDEIRVRQIIINMVNNAIKFTEEGIVKLRVRVKDISDGKAKIKISISDSGQGIKEEDLGKLFASFEQINTKKNHKKEGTGLGLAISKQLVEMMGGSIYVDSKFGKGTTFSFTIEQKIDEAVNTTDNVIDMSKLKAVFEGRKIAIECSNRYLEESLRENFERLDIEINALEPNADILFTDSSNVDNSTAKDKYILINPYKEVEDDKDFVVCEKPVNIISLYNIFVRDKNGKEEEKSEKENITFEGAKILLVEDNMVNREVALMLFEPLKMEIDTAEDGQKALEMVQVKDYDLVFMDHMMPVMDGVESTIAIRKLEDEKYKKLPIIALTANAISEAKDELISIGMNDVTTKPISMEHIISILGTYIKKIM